MGLAYKKLAGETCAGKHCTPLYFIFIMAKAKTMRPYCGMGCCSSCLPRAWKIWGKWYWSLKIVCWWEGGATRFKHGISLSRENWANARRIPNMRSEEYVMIFQLWTHAIVDLTWSNCHFGAFEQSQQHSIRAQAHGGDWVPSQPPSGRLGHWTNDTSTKLDTCKWKWTWQMNMRRTWHVDWLWFDW